MMSCDGKGAEHRAIPHFLLKNFIPRDLICDLRIPVHELGGVKNIDSSVPLFKPLHLLQRERKHPIRIKILLAIDISDAQLR